MQCICSCIKVSFKCGLILSTLCEPLKYYTIILPYGLFINLAIFLTFYWFTFTGQKHNVEDILRVTITLIIQKNEFKEAPICCFGIGVDLFKSISLMEGLLRFPSYFTNFSTYDQILCFCWFPSNSCYHSNGDAKHFVLDNVDYLEI